MCLKKKRFLQLLNEFPDAKRFYEKRAIDRRVEFRRVSIKSHYSVCVAHEEASQKDGRGKA